MPDPSPVLVDDRAGSRDLEPLLRDLKVPCQLTRLEYGDVAWEGKGKYGPVQVGIEYKRLRDALNCMTGGRFTGHQLPGMVERYPYPYLLLEGIWRSNPRDGILEEAIVGGWRAASMGSRRMVMGRDFDNWLYSLSTLTPLRIRTTDTLNQTVMTIRNMYQWWQKPWDEHASLHVVYSPAPPTALVLKPGLTRRVAAQFNHLGWERSGAVAERFRSPLDFALALPGELMEIPGIGRGIAESIMRQWEGVEE